MLTRSRRLRLRPDFKMVYARGRSAYSDLFSLRSLTTNTGSTRAAVVVSTKISKKAVTRNRIRRRTYSYLDSIWDKLKTDQDIVVIVKKDIARLPIKDIETDLKQCLNRLELLS